MYQIIHQLPFNGFEVTSTLTLPTHAKSLIIFSHSGSSGNVVPIEEKMVKYLQKFGYATLTYDFLHQYEKGYKIDVETLSRGLVTSILWLHDHSEYHLLELGLFGIAAGAASAFKAAAQLTDIVKAVVTLSARTDLVSQELSQIKCPVLLVTGELDFQGVKMNQQAIKRIGGAKNLAVVPGASRLFDETGKLKEVEHITGNWLQKHLPVATKDRWLEQH